jgi:2-keto-myo-inositol isomerase
MTFILCLNTSTIKTTPLLDKIRLTAEAGYRGVELWINDLYEFVGQGGEIRDIEQALAQRGLIVPCTIAIRGWGDAVGEEYPIVLDEVRRRMLLAKRLGSPYIVATPPRAECDLGQLTRRYKDLLTIGREVGIRPTFEYISFFRSASKLSQAWQVVRDVDAPDATLIVDAFHNWNSGSTLADLAAVPVEWISHYHFDDACHGKPALTQTDPDRVMPGNGCIDLRAEVKLLRDKGYQGTASLELFNRKLWGQDPGEVLKLGFERMRQYLGA